MNKICTSLEQSKKLVELGIDVKTADMIYQPTMDIDSMSNVGFDKIPLCFPFNEVKECNIQYLPAWSLSALLDLVAALLELAQEKNENLDFSICFGGYKGDEYISEWFCTFERLVENWEFITTSSNSAIDAVFDMIVKLHDLNIL